MNTDKRNALKWFCIICVYLCASVVPLSSFAQTTQPSDGLDALSDDALLEELASRGLDSLLDYAFAANRVPPEKQNGVRTIIAMRRLGDPSSKLTAQQRSKLVADVVRGIELALPTMHDPKLMMRQASDLIAAGVIDPVKVTRAALRNAASIAALVLTTETLVVEKPADEDEHAGHQH